MRVNGIQHPLTLSSEAVMQNTQRTRTYNMPNDPWDAVHVLHTTPRSAFVPARPLWRALQRAIKLTRHRRAYKTGLRRASQSICWYRTSDLSYILSIGSLVPKAARRGYSTRPYSKIAPRGPCQEASNATPSHYPRQSPTQYYSSAVLCDILKPCRPLDWSPHAAVHHAYTSLSSLLNGTLTPRLRLA